jgi:hypothetical protein
MTALSGLRLLSGLMHEWAAHRQLLAALGVDQDEITDPVDQFDQDAAASMSPAAGDDPRATRDRAEQVGAFTAAVG